MHPLEILFNPKTVAVVGASADPLKAGHIIFRSFAEGGYRGKVFPVNPHIPDLFGHKCYKSVRDIPYPLDLVVVASPADTVQKIVEECAQKKVKAVIVITSGFSEAGKPAPESAMRKTAVKTGMLMVGPNCLGVYDPVSLTDTIFLPKTKLERPGKGVVFLASQSGAMGAWAMDRLAQQGVGISRFLSYGNAAGVDQADIIDYANADPATKTIVLHLEGLRDGKKFFEALKRSIKPVVVVKTARTPLGAQAAKTHTAADAGNDMLFSAAVRQAGAFEAPDTDTAIDMARALILPATGSRAPQIITGAGGPAIQLADLFPQTVPLTSPTAETMKKIKTYCPAVTGSNPCDLGGNPTSAVYKGVIEACLSDPQSDLLVVLPVIQVPSLAADIIPILATLPKTKPILFFIGGGQYADPARKALNSTGAVVCSSLHGLAAGVQALAVRTARKRAEAAAAQTALEQLKAQLRQQSRQQQPAKQHPQKSKKKKRR